MESVVRGLRFLPRQTAREKLFFEEAAADEAAADAAEEEGDDAGEELLPDADAPFFCPHPAVPRAMTMARMTAAVWTACFKSVSSS